MNIQTKLAPAINKVSSKELFIPSITIIMPFNPKMTGSAAIQNQLRRIKKMVAGQVLEKYNDDLGIIVLQKLMKICLALNYGTTAQSLAIFVSPVFEKVLYLNFPVETQVTVDEVFSIEQVIHAKKDSMQYLLLDLASSPGHLYFGDPTGLFSVKTNYIKPAKDAEDFWKLDTELSLIMDAYSVPVFVIGKQEEVDNFKQKTSSAHHIVKYIYSGDRKIKVPDDLSDTIKTHLDGWDHIQSKFIHNQLMQARHEGKLICGMKNVSQSIHRHRLQRLLISHAYLESYKNKKETLNLADVEHYHGRYSYVSNDLDQLIETFLEEGGVVDFVPDDVLEEYQGVCMVIL